MAMSRCSRSGRTAADRAGLRSAAHPCGADIVQVRRLRRSQALTQSRRAVWSTVRTSLVPTDRAGHRGHRRQARHVSWPLVAVEGMEQPAVQHRLKTCAPNALDGTRQPRRTRPRSHGRRPSPGRSPVPSQLRQRPGPATPAMRREARSRRFRSPHRAPLRRIRLRMPTARWPAAAGRYPKAQGRRGK